MTDTPTPDDGRVTIGDGRVTIGDGRVTIGDETWRKIEGHGWRRENPSRVGERSRQWTRWLRPSELEGWWEMVASLRKEYPTVEMDRIRGFALGLVLAAREER